MTDFASWLKQAEKNRADLGNMQVKHCIRSLPCGCQRSGSEEMWVHRQFLDAGWCWLHSACDKVVGYSIYDNAKALYAAVHICRSSEDEKQQRKILRQQPPVLRFRGLY